MAKAFDLNQEAVGSPRGWASAFAWTVYWCSGRDSSFTWPGPQGRSWIEARTSRGWWPEWFCFRGYISQAPVWWCITSAVSYGREGGSGCRTRNYCLNVWRVFPCCFTAPHFPPQYLCICCKIMCTLSEKCLHFTTKALHSCLKFLHSKPRTKCLHFKCFCIWLGSVFFFYSVMSRHRNGSKAGFCSRVRSHMIA